MTVDSARSHGRPSLVCGQRASRWAAAAIAGLLSVVGAGVATPAWAEAGAVMLSHATSPAPPLVDSDVYSPTEWNGGPGVPGTFTFRPGAAGDDISHYVYSLDGGDSVRVEADAEGLGSAIVTPVRDLVNVLRVEAFDRAGSRSGAVDYQFLVRPISGEWHWGLDETAGTQAPSTPVNDRPARMSGSGVTWTVPGQGGSDGSARFTGEGELTTVSPVLDTVAPGGFTVAARVQLPGPGLPASVPSDDPAEGGRPSGGDAGDIPPMLPPAHSQTAVSQSGSSTSMFRLGYRNDVDVDHDGVGDPAWCMSVQAADSATGTGPAACAAVDVTPGEWVYLVGMVDPIADQIRLYVNGIPGIDGTLVEVPGAAGWRADGAFAIGRAGTEAAPAERWVGGIDEVYAIPRIWSDAEIAVHGF